VVRAAALTPGPVAIAIRLYLARGWRTDLPQLVLLLQAGNAVSVFGHGLILPFEIIYLHQIRGFATATAGLVPATILGTATLVTPHGNPASVADSVTGLAGDTREQDAHRFCTASRRNGASAVPERLICAR
jgi:hypothetical protein